MNGSKVIFGTSGLGNLYVEIPEQLKTSIVGEIIRCSPTQPIFDTAGKYGAGLALESLGQALRTLKIPAEDITISNKLGWIQTALQSEEPLFELGVWKNLKHDARQEISYDGIMKCYEQGNQLLNGYKARMLSVHDPDEYLALAINPNDAAKRYVDILDAYKALWDLKSTGKIESIGVGAKDWRIIQKISQDVDLDWVMFANSLTIYSHPAELVAFLQELTKKGVNIINSAVFNAGFLTGGNYFNYQLLDPAKDEELFKWRADFFQLCAEYQIKPAAACIAFALKVPGVTSIALNTTNPKRIQQNIEMANEVLPVEFWRAMQRNGLFQETLDFLQ